MKIKAIVSSVAVASIALAGAANAASDAQVAKLEKQVQQLQAQVNAMGNNGSKGSASSNLLNVNSDLTFDMINNQTDTTNTELRLLHLMKNGKIAENGLTVGAKAEMNMHYQRISNNNRTKFNAPVGNIVATGTAGSWVAAFVNVRLANQSNAFTPANSGPNTNPAFSSAYLQDAYVVVGNLKKSPFYAFAGRKNVDFGNFDDVSNVVPSMTQSFFMAQADQVGVGFHDKIAGGKDNGAYLTTTFTAMNGGGSGNWNTVTPANNINDFAVNATLNMDLNKDLSAHVGGGYINGTGFVSNGTTNLQSGVGAIDMNAGMVFGNQVQNLAVNGEFVITTHGVNGMQGRNSAFGNNNNVYTLTSILYGNLSNTNLTGSPFSGGSTVKALNLNTAYTMPVKGHSTVFFASYDNVMQNSTNRLYMLNLGGRTEVVHNVWAGLSYILAGGKMQASGVQGGLPTSQTIMGDVSAYF